MKAAQSRSCCCGGTLDRCWGWCRARHAGLMMLNQLLGISSSTSSQKTAATTTASAGLRTPLKELCIMLHARKRGGDQHEVHQFHLWGRNTERSKWRDRHACARLPHRVPRIDLWQPAKFRELLVEVEFGHLAVEDPQRTICTSVWKCECEGVCVHEQLHICGSMR